MRTVEVWTDGSCLRNPNGPGGWAAVLCCDGHQLPISGGNPSTTNNRMEMTALLEAAVRLKEPVNLIVVTDSNYLLQAFKDRWVFGWKKRGWKKANGDPVANPDLWEKLIDALAPHTVTWRKVKGHAGIDMNEQVDQMAGAAAREAARSAR